MINQIIVYGFIEIPYPYLENFNSYIKNNQGKKKYKDFPDFISTVIECRSNAICSFAYILSYENGDEKEIAERFMALLRAITFLRAALHFNIDEKDYQYFQYYSDGEKVYKYKNDVNLSERPVSD